MVEISRTDRQNEIWDEFQAIRNIVDYGLLDPTAGGYEPEDEGDPEADDLQDAWNDLVEEYGDIHTDNETKG